MSDPDARLDVLRRRLYLPGVTDEDVQRYLDALPMTASEPEQSPEPEHRRPRRRARIVAACAALVVAAAVVLTVTTRPSSPAAAVDIGDGRLLTVQPGAASRGMPVAVSIDGVATAGQRFTGRGNAVVDFTAPAGTANGGRAMVRLTSAEPATVRWRALLLLHRANGTSFAISLARGSTAPGTSTATPDSFIYPSGPPQRVSVEAPAGLRWTLVVAVTGVIDAQLR